MYSGILFETWEIKIFGNQKTTEKCIFSHCLSTPAIVKAFPT